MDSLTFLLENGIAEHRTPCAVLHAFKLNGGSITLTAGCHTYDTSRAVRQDDLFDLASITKVMATTAVAMAFVRRGLLDLDTPISAVLTERAAMEGPQPTFRQLLAHCGGMPPFLPFHRDCAALASFAARRGKVIETTVAYAPQSQCAYSDVGFMLLGFALERIGMATLDVLAQQLVFQPLGMSDTRFAPPETLRERCVPTERICGDGCGRCWQGIVHDENARWLGGIAGHAGLFSTAADMGIFARAMLSPDGAMFSGDVLRAFTRPACLVPGSSRCLGWDSPTQPGSSGGARVSPTAFGHTGFTGTSFWIDPQQGIAVILLTNAVHPTRDGKTNYFPWRNSIHTAVYDALDRW